MSKVSLIFFALQDLLWFIVVLSLSFSSFPMSHFNQVFYKVNVYDRVSLSDRALVSLKFQNGPLTRLYRDLPIQAKTPVFILGFQGTVWVVKKKPCHSFCKFQFGTKYSRKFCSIRLIPDYTR